MKERNGKIDARKEDASCVLLLLRPTSQWQAEMRCDRHASCVELPERSHTQPARVALGLYAAVREPGFF